MTSLANENTSMHTARQVESIFKTHAETPVVTSGSLFAEPGSNMVKIKVYQSQKDLINDKIEKQYLEHIVRRDNAEKLNGRKFSVLLSNTIPSPLGCIYETTSPDGQYLVKLICIVNEDGKKKYFFDVYGSNKRLHRMALDKYHNDVILKHPFHNGFSWAPPSKGIDFQTLVYIAERKPSVDDPQNNATVLKLFQEDKKKNENKVYDTTEYEYEDDYGEQLETVQRPTPYVLRFDTTKCSILNIVDPTQQNMAFGTPVFMPNKKGIVCTGWENIKLRRHGIIYYNTRPSKLYRIDVDLNLVSRPRSSNVRSITNDVETDYSCCNPSFIGNSLIYLTTMKTQRHNSASRLKRIEYDPTRDQFVCDQQNILIDVEPFTKSVPVSSTGEIDTTEDTETGTFSGIYDRGTWPAKQLYLSNDIMAFSSSNRSCMDIYFYDLRNLSLSQFEIPKFLRASKDEGYACRVLACQDNLMLWTFSKRNMMERLFVSDTSLISSEHVTLSSPESIMKSKSIRTITLQAAHFENAEFSKAIHHIKSEVITLEKDDICYQGILSYRPSENLDEDDDTQLPLVAMPHGGPHSNIIANYDSVISFLNSVGFGVLCLNYRGSLAYGTASEESLPGYIGQNDVFDCHSLINFTLSKYKHIFDSNNVFVVGGSHGGFLTAHLISQYPNLFKAACARNPVLNIATEVASTDIPDWCYTEVGLKFPNDGKTPAPRKVDYMKMFDSSPISLIDNVKTPLLLMLGGKDRRVPWDQSFDYYHILRSRGVTCKILKYNDLRHALSDSCKQEGDVWVNVLLWFIKHLEERRKNEDRLRSCVNKMLNNT